MPVFRATSRETARRGGWIVRGRHGTTRPCAFPGISLTQPYLRRWMTMTKRYREAVEVDLDDDGDPHAPPTAFTWRGGRYRVLSVLGHWREDARWWAGAGIEVPQRDLWRVEAQNGTPSRGIYELVAEGSTGQGPSWRLDRVWD